MMAPRTYDYRLPTGERSGAPLSGQIVKASPGRLPSKPDPLAYTREWARLLSDE